MLHGPRLSRRDALRVAGGAALAGVLAACTDGATPSAGPAPSGALVPTPTPGASPQGLDVLAQRLSAPLLRPGSAEYASAAHLYDARYDATARPAAIARCASTDDVAACVRYAASGGAQPQPLHLRAGGHSYGGWSTGPGLVADVRPMSAVAVDRAAGTARIGAGALLVDVYAALAAQGVALAAGSCPTVGLTGLALGGGVGVLTRAYGLTCDALRSAEVVTADGNVLEVDAGTHADLFWALRGGGGGSFAAVTALTVAVRPEPTVRTFFLSWADDRAAAVLSAWQGWVAAADRQLWSTCKVLATPADGRVRVVVAGTWIGRASELAGRLAPLLAAVGAPATTSRHSTLAYGAAMLYEAGCSGQDAASCTADALSPADRRPFAATSALLPVALPADGLTAAVEGVRRGLEVAGMVEGGVSFDALGGAVADLAPDATAFVHRQALASLQYTATWSSGSADPAPYDAFVRAQRTALLPWTGQTAYVNYPDASLPDPATAYWGDNLPRLREVKRTYDPDDLFTFAQSVRA